MDACIDQVRQQHAQPRHMHVGVVEARYYKLPFCIDHACLRADHAACVGIASNRDNSIPQDGDRLGLLGRTDRSNVRVSDD